MASRKRSRETHDVDGESEIEIESASSSFRMNDQHTKRTRVALAQAAGGSVVSDEEDYLMSDTNNIDEISDDDDGGNHNPDVEYSLRQDSSDDDREEYGIDELRATQFVHRQFKEHRENIAADHGVVEEIYCTNFMCHSKLRVKLGPLINFIIGHNGSGKSAVLTALQVCLGTKASDTSRAKGLKSLIKQGTDRATVGVMIKNEGESAYKPELYGRTIAVERHFTTSGSSQFKLISDPGANRKGVTISTKKADLDDMLDYFGLQMDNPINVLTQDKARAFLSNSTPMEKYRFFMKGTQLETLHGDYTMLEENLDNINAKLDHNEENVKVLKEKLEEAERRKQRAESSRRLHSKIMATNREWAWSQIEAEERELEEYEKDVEKGRDSLTEAEQAAEAASNQYDSQEQAVEAQTRAIEEHERALEPLKEAHGAVKERFDLNTKALLELKSEERTIKDSFNSAKRSIARTSSEIATERERLAGEHGEVHTRRLEELDRLKELAVDADQALKEHEAGLAELKAVSEAAKQSFMGAKDPAATAREDYDRQKSHLNRLQRDQGNKWGPYARNMDKLCQEIDRETRWRKKPVGPMGMFVHLTKPQWSSIAETTCGGVLSSFAVTCKYDQNIFDTIANRVGIRVTSYITDDSPMDTSNTEPEEGVDTILRILRIEKDIIRNTLIINNMIDQTVLFEKREEGKRFMYDNGRPRNVSATITMAPGDGNWGSRWDYTRAGDQKVGPVRAWNGAARMKADRKEEIRLQQDRVQSAQSRLSQAEQRVTELQNESNKAQQAVIAHQRKQRQLKEASQRAEDNIQAKQSEIDANQPKDGQLQELERQLEEAMEEKKNAEQHLEDAATKGVSLDTTARELKDEVEAAVDEMDRVKRMIEKAERKKVDVDNARGEALRKKNEACDHVDWWKAQVTRLEEKVNDQKQTIEGHLPIAQGISPERVPVTKAPDELEALIKQLQAKWDREQATQQGTAEQINEDWQKAQQTYARAKKESRDMKRCADIMMQTLAERQRRWGLFRGHISMRTRINFSYLLTERKFRGRLTFNHTDKTLDLHIEPDMTKASDAGRQTKTLSGGEKSFSTICLLLSIWEAMGSPIRCLDEFDVFMDSVNRAQSMRMMIETARRSVGRQFILITPQAMGNVEIHDDVTIHKMSDPERGREPGQQPLNFGQA